MEEAKTEAETEGRRTEKEEKQTKKIVRQAEA